MPNNESTSSTPSVKPAGGSLLSSKQTKRPGKTSKKRKKTKSAKTRTRAARPYPASSFYEAMPLGAAIHQYASGQRVRRLTLLQQMQKSPTSSAAMMLITNSGKYKITTGSYSAEWLALTPTGSIATEPGAITDAKLQAQFSLAIQGVATLCQTLC